MRRLLASMGVALGIMVSTAAFTAPMFATSHDCSGPLTVDGGIKCATPGGSPKASTFESVWKIAINTIIYAVGAIAVLMVIIGGLMYVLSGGDPAGTRKAKDTILYAVIGVVVALMAYALVRFVSRQF